MSALEEIFSRVVSVLEPAVTRARYLVGRALCWLLGHPYPGASTVVLRRGRDGIGYVIPMSYCWRCEEKPQ